MKVLIVEDEQPAATRLQKLILAQRPQTLIAGVLDSVEDAVAYFETGEKLDLVFMDIQLADGLSFDIFSKTKVNAPVIFTTAFDHYAVKAFKVNSVDYLLKPVEEEELKNAITKFENIYAREQQPDFAAVIKAIKERTTEFKKRFLVKTAGRLAFVNVEDLAYFFSDDGNSFLVTTKGDRFLIDSILDEIETQLDPAKFFRINRAMILSLWSIKKIEPHFNNRFAIDLSPPFGEQAIVSRQRSAEFRTWLDS